MKKSLCAIALISGGSSLLASGIPVFDGSNKVDNTFQDLKQIIQMSNDIQQTIKQKDMVILDTDLLRNQETIRRNHGVSTQYTKDLANKLLSSVAISSNIQDIRTGKLSVESLLQDDDEGNQVSVFQKRDASQKTLNQVSSAILGEDEVVEIDTKTGRIVDEVPKTSQEETEAQFKKGDKRRERIQKATQDLYQLNQQQQILIQERDDAIAEITAGTIDDNQLEAKRTSLQVTESSLAVNHSARESTMQLLALEEKLAAEETSRYNLAKQRTNSTQERVNYLSWVINSPDAKYDVNAPTKAAAEEELSGLQKK